jgi:hypothetical protein
MGYLMDTLLESVSLSETLWQALLKFYRSNLWKDLNKQFYTKNFSRFLVISNLVVYTHTVLNIDENKKLII